LNRQQTHEGMKEGEKGDYKSVGVKEEKQGALGKNITLVAYAEQK